MNPQTADLLLTHALLVTQDDERQIIADGAIAINGEHILAVGPAVELAGRYTARQTFDLSGQIVFPGLINTHTHLFQVGAKGLGEDMPVQGWVEMVTAPTAIHIDPDEMYLFSLTGCLEQIHSGVTTLVDMSYCAHSFALHETNIQAIQESGLRGRYSTIISDFGEEYGVLPGLIRPIDWFIREYTRLHQSYPADDRLAVWMAIGAPWTVTDPGLLTALEYADRTSTPIVMHINENEVDNQLFQQRHARNIVPYLADIGFLRPDLLAVHCVRCDETDIQLFRQHDVKISYNPVSNMYLGSGIAPIVAMAAAGLTISVGVDGASSNNSQDMLESLKIAALLQKVAHQNAAVVNAQQVLDWATRQGARALGLEDEIGSLEAGKRADLFVMALNSAKVIPLHDPVASLVYSSGQENVVMTIANGKVLMRDRVIQHLDEEGILRRCQSAALALAERCGSNARLQPVLRKRGAL